MDQFQQAAELLKAISHPERLRILVALRDGEECVCHLTTLLRQRQPYVSQQLGYLKDAGLISDHKDGLRVYYRIEDRRILQLLDTIGEMIGHSNGLGAEQASQDKLTSCPCPRCAAE